ncbi:MAG: hypothetical protein NC039_06910 [Muribaculaceae bacterium]|nr:hypothetical protein [Muribaculaceae bacterium]
MRLNILSLLILLLLPAGASAQKLIKSVIEKIEASGTIKDDIYREKRDAETHSVIMCDRMIEFSNENLADALIKAFKDERSNSTDYEMNETRGSKENIYKIEFTLKSNNNVSYYHTYTLICDKKIWTLRYEVKRKADSNARRKQKKTAYIVEGDGLEYLVLDGCYLNDVGEIVSQ